MGRDEARPAAATNHVAGMRRPRTRHPALLLPTKRAGDLLIGTRVRWQAPAAEWRGKNGAFN